MVPVILICAVLTLLGLVAITRDLYEKINCIEATGEVTGHKEVYDTESHDVNAYVPIIITLMNQDPQKLSPKKAVAELMPKS